MSEPPYLEGVCYLWSSIVVKSYSFGRDGINLNVVTKPVENVQYIATFKPIGIAPYNGQMMKCIYVKELPY